MVYWSYRDKTLITPSTIIIQIGRPNIYEVLDVHCVGGYHRPLCVSASRFAGFLHLFCESVHLRFTLRSLQKSAEADAEQECCYSYVLTTLLDLITKTTSADINQ